jgi:Trk K+ transport system NAD-binding subunit
MFCIYHVNTDPVIIVGGGRVGRATARALVEREGDYRIVEPMAERVRDAEKYVHGSAADLATLERAGIRTAPAVVITTRDDDTNIYLTIYCRRLRPDIQIISRTTRERNVSTLYRAGADSVLSYGSMGATAIFNSLNSTDIVMVAEGLHLAQSEVPRVLWGKTLAEAAIPRTTQCNVVALKTTGGLKINPDPATRMEAGAQLVLACTSEAAERFGKCYGVQAFERAPIVAQAGATTPARKTRVLSA